VELIFKRLMSSSTLIFPRMRKRTFTVLDDRVVLDTWDLPSTSLRTKIVSTFTRLSKNLELRFNPCLPSLTRTCMPPKLPCCRRGVNALLCSNDEAFIGGQMSPVFSWKACLLSNGMMENIKFLTHCMPISWQLGDV
jgi:hypothetical protein